MNNRYLPMTEADKKEMLASIGVDSIEELFSDIPEEIRFKGQLDVKEALKEPELVRYFQGLPPKTYQLNKSPPFLGQECMSIISLRSSIMSSLVRNFILLILLTSQKSRKVNCRQSLNSKR